NDMFFFYVFFFQAEDGIRDFHVTGVQTCALPILYDENGNPIQDVLTLDQSNIQNEKYNIQSEVAPPIFQFALRFELTDKGLKTRSEERRVGKECRYRWSLDR